jgi:hypothetical protein
LSPYAETCKFPILFILDALPIVIVPVDVLYNETDVAATEFVMLVVLTPDENEFVPVHVLLAVNNAEDADNVVVIKE